MNAVQLELDFTAPKKATRAKKAKKQKPAPMTLQEERAYNLRLLKICWPEWTLEVGAYCTTESFHHFDTGGEYRIKAIHSDGTVTLENDDGEYADDLAYIWAPVWLLHPARHNYTAHCFSGAEMLYRIDHGTA